MNPLELLQTSTQNLEVKKASTEVFQALKEKIFLLRQIRSTKQSFKVDGRFKCVHDQELLKKFRTTGPATPKILKVILERDNEDSNAKTVKWNECTREGEQLSKNQEKMNQQKENRDRTKYL